MRSLAVIAIVVSVLAVARPLSAEEAVGATWLPAIAALTDPRDAVNLPAMETLVQHGLPALADVAALSKDVDWQLRARVATVVAGIGGEAASEILVGMIEDRDDRVREVVMTGLGRTPGTNTFGALEIGLKDPSARVRIAAALGIGNLGDPKGLAALAGFSDGNVPEVRRARIEALRRLANRPDMIPSVIIALETSKGPTLLRLLDAVVAIGDPRLNAVLSAILLKGDDNESSLAALALAGNGDTRSFEALCTMAANNNRIQPARVAADTLTKLTGVNASAGAAWSIWWRENAETVAGLTARDTFIASLYNLDQPVTRADLAAFTPEQLMPLIDGLLGEGAWWWRRRAGQVLMIDDPARWTPVLFRRIDYMPRSEERLSIIILVDQYGDPGAKQGFQKLWNDLPPRDEKVRKNDPERAALLIAMERREGVNATSVRPTQTSRGRTR